MGILRRHKDSGNPNRFLMKERLLAIAQDFYIENGAGLRCYWIDGKALRVRETILFREVNGVELYKVQQRKLRLRDTMRIEDPHGHTIATVKKHLIEPIHQRFDISVEDAQDMTAKGNILAHEYKIKQEGHVVAEISKKWIRVRDTYTVDVDPGANVPFLLAVTSAIDTMADPG